MKNELASSCMLPVVLQQLEFTWQLVEITSGNEALISAIRDTKVTSLKGFALVYDRVVFATLIKSEMR